MCCSAVIFQMNHTFYKAVTFLWRSMKLDIHGKIKYLESWEHKYIGIYLNVHHIIQVQIINSVEQENFEELFHQSVPSPIYFLYILAFIKIISNKSLQD